MGLSKKQIIDQSNNAISQWGALWEKHCLHHKETQGKFIKQNLADYENTGIGKACLLVANGYSFECEIETIKKYKDNVDVVACDKTMGHLLNHGITPKFVIVCDANVNYEKYMEHWKDQLQDTVIFQNICGNPKWVDNGNWKNKYFFSNRDVLKSEKKWMELSGCINSIPAGTNVSNAMIVFMTQSDNEVRRNFFGYDKILLVGFDYSWPWDGHYYAFDKDAGGKRNYMRHVFGKNHEGGLCYTSNNLNFSSKWAQEYINAFKLPVIQCSKKSILRAKSYGALAEQMQYNYRKEDSAKVRGLVAQRRKIAESLKEIEMTLRDIGKDHYMQVMRTS
jgi:hypothetical protein